MGNDEHAPAGRDDVAERVTHVAAAEAADRANAIWHRPLVQIIAGTLSGSTAQTPGMTRLEAISGQDRRLGEAVDGPDPRRPVDELR